MCIRDRVTIPLGAVYAVDVFFFMSGFLFCFIFLAKIAKSPKGLTPAVYGMTLFHRIYRLWPCLFLTIMLWWKVAPALGSGPMWNEFIKSTKACDQEWWPALLFVDNFHSSFNTQYCLPWGWYLSTELQMFLLAPIVVYIFKKNQTAGKAISWLLVVFATGLGFIISMEHNFRVMVPNPAAKTDFMAAFWDIYYLSLIHI
eukprot:TRINITY_DN24030_c0_g2_i1.p1 TRINITY_DN24030_c0_g2~~TRINITY_DN24030_c0_g2_i1.p1  ORF type:complete len:213 (+),score=82.32 TRINITY_DN24030_c0_g2_i1:40-639(+)